MCGGALGRKGRARVLLVAGEEINVCMWRGGTESGEGQAEFCSPAGRFQYSKSTVHWIFVRSLGNFFFVFATFLKKIKHVRMCMYCKDELNMCWRYFALVYILN